MDDCIAGFRQPASDRASERARQRKSLNGPENNFFSVVTTAVIAAPIDSTTPERKQYLLITQLIIHIASTWQR